MSDDEDDEEDGELMDSDNEEEDFPVSAKKRKKPLKRSIPSMTDDVMTLPRFREKRMIPEKKNKNKKKTMRTKMTVSERDGFVVKV